MERDSPDRYRTCLAGPVHTNILVSSRCSVWAWLDIVPTGMQGVRPRPRRVNVCMGGRVEIGACKGGSGYKRMHCEGVEKKKSKDIQHYNRFCNPNV